MKISTRTEYGVRVLVTLARHGAEGPQSLAAIARAEKLPHAYLEQLVGDLRRAGLLTATRGHAGGYQLARPAEQITLDQVVRALEGPLRSDVRQETFGAPGAEDLEACNRPQPCSVHELFQRVHEALDGTLSSTTLAEAAATAGGPPYPPAVRRRAAEGHAALMAAREQMTSEAASASEQA